MVSIIPYTKVSKDYPGRNVLMNDSCGKRTVGVLTNGATMIPLCEDCLKKTRNEIEIILGKKNKI